MSKHIHKLSQIDETTKTGLCANCGEVPLKRKKQNNGQYGWRCKPAYLKFETKRVKKRSPSSFTRTERGIYGNYTYRQHVKDSCEKCGFIPEHSVQLDVDHIDGNHQNHDPDNLQTLCANCHRLKTYLNKDGIFKVKDLPLE